MKNKQILKREQCQNKPNKERERECMIGFFYNILHNNNILKCNIQDISNNLLNLLTYSRAFDDEKKL